MRQLIILIVLVLCISCGNKNAFMPDYSKLDYDTARITIFQWDTTNKKFPPNSDPLPLVQEDLFIVDSLLGNAIDTFNTNFSAKLYEVYNHSATINLYTIHRENYKYQYFPYEDVNGKRIVSLYGHIHNYSRSEMITYGAVRHFGLEINLTDKTRSDNLSKIFDCTY